jgi:hypothetical protein
MFRHFSKDTQQRARRRTTIRTGVKRRLKKTRHAFIELMGFIALGASVAFLASPSLVNAMFSDSAITESANTDSSRNEVNGLSVGDRPTNVEDSRPYFNFELANKGF